jgi:hypothetical protein
MRPSYFSGIFPFSEAAIMRVSYSQVSTRSLPELAECHSTSNLKIAIEIVSCCSPHVHTLVLHEEKPDCDSLVSFFSSLNFFDSVRGVATHGKQL